MSTSNRDEQATTDAPTDLTNIENILAAFRSMPNIEIPIPTLVDSDKSSQDADLSTIHIYEMADVLEDNKHDQKVVNFLVELMALFTTRGESLFTADDMAAIEQAANPFHELMPRLLQSREIKELLQKYSDVQNTPRRSNRKITKTTFPNNLLPVPNILNHGTRRLGQMLAGAADWTIDTTGHAMLAMVNGETVGMIKLNAGGEDEAGRIIDALGPRSLKCMVAISGLIFSKTRGSLVNHGATISVGELARAMGYKPNASRSINQNIILRIAAELRGLTKITTWAADSSWDRKAKRANSGWIAPLLVISAIHTEQAGLDGTTVPIEFDAMLGRNWAAAMQERYDVLQVAPGFMELEPTRDDQPIRLAWFYLTDFRYRMRRGERKDPMRIADLCASARLNTGQARDRGRFLDRLHAWHGRIQELGIIGSYQRTPDVGTDWAPARIFSEGSYKITRPKPILEAYNRNKEKRASQ